MEKQDIQTDLIRIQTAALRFDRITFPFNRNDRKMDPKGHFTRHTGKPNNQSDDKRHLHQISDRSKVECHFCHRLGHYEKDCFQKNGFPGKDAKKTSTSKPKAPFKKRIHEMTKMEDSKTLNVIEHEMNYIAVKPLSKNATLPERKTPGSAGLDLTPCESGTIQPGEQALVDTGISMAIPRGHVGKIEVRSSIAKMMVDVKAGTIDSDYRGSIKMLLYNYSKHPLDYKAGGKAIAQLVIYLINTDHCQEVE